MIKNYLKITITILKRKKIFSVITILGIAIPLMFLMIIISTISHISRYDSPQSNFDRVLFIKELKWSIERKVGLSGNMSGMPSYDFVKNHVKKMKSPEKIGVASSGEYFNLYLGNEKTKLKVVYTDGEFWDIADFKFTEGKAYNATDVEDSQLFAVIDEYTRELIFGEDEAIGKTVKFFRRNYRITGVVKNVDVTRRWTHANVYLPVSSSENYSENDIMGAAVHCFLLAGSKDNFPQIKEEFDNMIDNFQLGAYEGLTEIDGELGTDSINKTIRDIFQVLFSININKDKIIYITYLVIFFFFILLPSINLLYIHISRINERSSEIGVRKSFGGNKRILSGQFLFENLSITIFSGIMGLLLSLLFFIIINNSNIIPGLQMGLDFRSILLILLLWILFGLVTGYLPALRMSRMKIIDALHQYDSFQYFDFMIWKGKRLKMLLAAEFALTFIALVAISVFVFKFRKNNTYPLGFDYNNVYQVSAVQYDRILYSFGERKSNDDILEMVKTNAFVEYYGEFRGNEPYHEGYTKFGHKEDYNDILADKVHLSEAGPDMDKVFSLNMVSGRWFEKQDDRPDYYPVVINKSLEQKLFKGGNATGKYIQLDDVSRMHIIGVIDHYKYKGEFSEPVDIIFAMNYFPNIWISSWGKKQTDFFRVRPGTTTGQVNDLARTISSKFPDFEIEIVSLETERIKYIRKIWGPLVAVFTVFLFVLLIVLLGLFGVLWYNISLRKAEIGLRRAVGANSGRIFLQIIREMLSWASVGIIIGTLIFIQIPLLNLYPVEPEILITSILSSAFIIYILATMCSLIPAFKTAKTEPAVALHEE